MAQASRTERKRRRRKIDARVAAQQSARTNRQYLRELSARLVNAQFTLMAVLRGNGGSIVVSKDDATAIMQSFAHLTFTTERREEDGGMVVTVVDDRAEVADPAEILEVPVRPDRSVISQLMARPHEGLPPAEPARTDVEGA